MAPEDTSLSDALGSLAAAALSEEPEADSSGSILADLAANAPQEVAASDQTDTTLAALAAQAPSSTEASDTSAAVLAELAAREEIQEQKGSAADDILATIERSGDAEEEPEADLAALIGDLPAAEEAVADTTESILAGIEAVADQPETDNTADILAGIEALTEEPEAEDTDLAALLGDLETPSEEETTSVADVLAGLESVAEVTPEPEADLSALLADLVTPEEDAVESTEAILAGIEAVADQPETDNTDDILAGIEALTEEPTAEDTDLAALLGDLETPTEEEATSVAHVLAGLDSVVEATPEPEADLTALLGDLTAPEEDAVESTDAILAGIETVSDAPETDNTDDILAGIEALAEEPAVEDTDLAALLGDLETPSEEEVTSVADVLAGLDPVVEATPEPEADLTALLGDLTAPEEDAVQSTEAILAGIEIVSDAAEEDLDLDALLGSLDSAGEDPEESTLEDLLSTLEPENGTVAASASADEVLDDGETDEDPFDLDALLGEVTGETSSDTATDESFDLDALLDEAATEEQPSEPENEDFDLDSLLADLPADAPAEADEAFDLDAMLAEVDADPVEDVPVDEANDLDDLLADLGLSDEVAEGTDDLDALFSELETEAEAAGEADDLSDLDALLGDLDSEEKDDSDLDLDSLLGDLGLDLGTEEDAASPETPEEPRSKEPELAYGTMSANRPEPQKLERKRFRLAIFGDFTGRAAKGQLDTGDALAAHKPMVLDPDTFEEVIESFATELVLPIGKEGAGIAVKLREFDDLHPDELFDNVGLFSELIGLRKQLQSGVTKDHAIKTLTAWAEAHGTPARAPKGRSGGNAVPADLRLSDFQKLIGDTSGSLRTASPIEDMLARVVGPHIRALPDANLGAMQAAVDEALSDAMRLVLHHPEFQSIEAQWRSLDLIQRSIEVDDTLEVVLYDVSAEELAADLAAQEDLSESGFVKLLTEGPMDPENGRGAYSALIGLYTFEETPPHAELLGRFARVAAHVDAPFLASVTPGFWDTAKEDRPKIVADAWDTLRGMTEAGHLGLLTPRFLLRRPYGAKSEPIDPFDFEEFTPAEGLRGMLWGNPVVLAAILMAKSFKKNGSSLQLGSIMSLGEMPYHYVNDRFGDQVALPCTERNVDLDKIASAKERGFMSIASVRGRDEIRLTSFNSLRGDVLLGPWTGQPAPAPSPADPRPAKPAPAAPEAAEDLDLADLGLDLDLDGDGGGLDDDLDALLAGFGDDDTSFDGDLDAELEALLNDL
ncbi:type VI secretion system contractile sheath domain-containing protein [Arenibacterium sp. LLYu02]|uniref:type VI secretion system contractile sheath domain-containing protein n=1 Tax=Arenibacterium sp. LLYu02 TaxID=3404132 RepID=UPI003B216C71